MIYLIEFYFIINAFIAGNLINDFRRSEAWRRIFYTVGLMLSGIPYVILIIVLSYSIVIWGKINGLTQIDFYFKFYVLRGYYNVDEIELKRANKCAKDLPDNTFAFRSFKNGVRLINKRNNYTPKP